MNIIHYLAVRLINEYYRLFIYPKAQKQINLIHAHSIDYTIRSLINSNKSLSRFGDGEMRRVIGQENLSKEKADRFEKNSYKLRNRLIHVLTSNQNNLEIGISSVFYGFKDRNPRSKRFCKLLVAKYCVPFMKYLNKNKEYYSSEFSRFYMGGTSRNKSGKRFKLLKKIWQNKDILIIEGNECRIGLNNNLLSNAKHVYRIECPATNAFESYNKILKYSLKFLSHNNNVLTLISLGPSATILSYDLTRNGYRAIDIGQVDIEYEWYLNHATHKINIPDRYVSEVDNGSRVIPIHNKMFINEIIKEI